MKYNTVNMNDDQNNGPEGAADSMSASKILPNTHEPERTRDGGGTNADLPAAETISVRPGVQMLGILQHLNYKSWFALAEFVDNSIQSYLANLDRLRTLHGADFTLRVEIEIEDTDTPRIIVRDNAAGIATGDYQRAFRPADVPPDRTGLSEFGMGMKSAACWFGSKWRVRTKALGEDFSGTVEVNVDDIVRSGTEQIVVVRRPADRDSHYTEILIEALKQVPRRRGIAKIRTYLADIYRVYLRRGMLELLLNGEKIEFIEPAVLRAPRHDAPAGAPEQEWRKEIRFTTTKGVTVRGFAGILAAGRASGAGFALLRRDRLIQGLSEEGWKPEDIFGKANTFRSQRVFGELFLEGVAVSHTKDGFQLEEHEDEIIPMLRNALDEGELPLLKQAEGFRVRVSKPDLSMAANSSVEHTIATVEKQGPDKLSICEAKSHVAAAAEQPTGTLEPILPSNPETSSEPNAGARPVSSPLIARRESRAIKVGAEEWQVVIELTDDPAVSDLIRVGESLDAHARSITIRFSLAHPFTQRFVSDDMNTLEPLLRLACAIGLAQVLARKAGVAKPGVVLMNANELLREVLCHD
jgi:hypothetical protein